MSPSRNLSKAVGTSASLIALMLAGLGAGAAAAQNPSARHCATQRALGRFPPGCPRPPRPQPPAPAPAPTPPPGPGPTVNARAADLRVGARVRNLDGAVLGTIMSADAAGAVVDSSMGRGRLPLGAFGRNNRGLVVSRARLAAAIAARAGPGQRVSAPFTVFFENDRDEITPAAAAILDNAAAAWRRLGNPSARVHLAGHTDSRASDEYSVSLSQRMAENVRTQLAGRGIPAGVITTEAFGESRPLVETPDGVREPQNRRVEISFVSGADSSAAAQRPPPAPAATPVERTISLNNRCTEQLQIRLLYFSRTGSFGWAGPQNGPGYVWTVQPGSAITIGYSAGGAAIIATSSEMYVHVTGQNGQPWQLANAVSRAYGTESYPFAPVTAGVNGSGQWEVRFCGT